MKKETKAGDPADKVRDTVRAFWRKCDKDIGGYDSASPQNRYNMQNLLAGFLWACERFGHLTHPEADEMFTELTGLKP